MYVCINLGWIYDCIIDHDSKNKKKLDYGINYTEKFETSIETQISQAIETSLRRVSSHVCLPSLLAILI